MADPVTPKCSDGWCEVPGGDFKMGSNDGNPDEKPVRTVTITGFELGQTEVSVSDYIKYLGDKLDVKFSSILLGRKNSDTTQAATLGQQVQDLAYAPQNLALSLIYMMVLKPIIISSALPDFRNNKKGDEYPVVGLNFDETQAYCQAQGGTLPTAAQLHYASHNDDDSKYEDQLVIWDNGFRSTEPVTAGYQNAYGIYNLLGNVWESALDAYDTFFYKRMPNKDPYNPLTNPKVTAEDYDDPTKQWQELSGGSFTIDRWRACPANRYYALPDDRSSYVGFRCARPLPEAAEENQEAKQPVKKEKPQ